MVEMSVACVDTTRLPNHSSILSASSIFSAELYDSIFALQRIDAHTSSKFTVFTDPLSYSYSFQHHYGFCKFLLIHSTKPDKSFMLDIQLHECQM